MGSETFNYTGGWQKFEVPADVEIVELDLHGAGSGVREGGRVVGKLRVRPRDTLFIMVGQQGQTASGHHGGDAAFGGGGRGGDAEGSRDGGNGGGGASAVRLNAKDGPIRAVAGGAGGKSGDNGHGGAGGGDTGAPGDPGTSGAGATGNATGGTQTQGGKSGTSLAGTIYYGHDADNQRLSRGGAGGNHGPDRHGGGGGGGGFYPGGGGQAARVGEYPGGGGGGGSNFSEPLWDTTGTGQGNGGTGHGVVHINWVNPDVVPPPPPEDITINGDPISDGLATKATDIIIRGTPGDPAGAGHGARMLVRLSRNSSFRRYHTHRGTYDNVEDRDKVTINNLTKDTRYYARIYTEDTNHRLSKNYRSTNFWTNRRPDEPTITNPSENATFEDLDNVLLEWNHVDPDPGDSQTGSRVRWRRAGTPIREPGKWSHDIENLSSFEAHTFDAGTFGANRFYEVQVRTRDEQHAWGEWSEGRSFYIYGNATPPTLVQPENDEAVPANEDTKFRWKFLKPQKRATQIKADLRYRIPTSPGWITIAGDPDPGTPGSAKHLTIPAETFVPGYPYEWQVRTYSTAGYTSAWSDSSFFWAVPSPDDSTVDGEFIESGEPAAPLGQGNNRVFIYDRGGRTMRGELTPCASIQWGRKRDDISNALVTVQNFDHHIKAMIRSTRCWQNELVIFRDGERVFEGPITRIGGPKDVVTIEAKDVMAYPYRRIMRQGYNDAYRIVNGEQVGLKSVVKRATLILINALGYDDPNVIAHITPITAKGDAKESRRVKDYSCTAWEEIDSLAATGGLDYVTSGRRILLWDTHNPLGRLPEMRAGDFSDNPIITEYGMNMANYLAATNNNGIWGAARRGMDDNGQPGDEGWIEMLISAFGEADEAKANRKLSRKARRRLRRTLREQAKRTIAGRWPAPLVVRVPDNTTLNPDLNIGINQLIPGVWIPVRAEDTFRELTQWQKLDSMQVRQDSAGEVITVTMSPAPNAGGDPDAGNVDEDATTGDTFTKAKAVDDAVSTAENSQKVLPDLPFSPIPYGSAWDSLDEAWDGLGPDTSRIATYSDPDYDAPGSGWIPCNMPAGRVHPTTAGYAQSPDGPWPDFDTMYGGYRMVYLRRELPAGGNIKVRIDGDLWIYYNGTLMNGASGYTSPSPTILERPDPAAGDGTSNLVVTGPGVLVIYVHQHVRGGTDGLYFDVEVTEP